MTKKSESLRKEIDQLSDEIQTLQNRRESVQESFDALTDSMASGAGEEALSEEIRSLKNDKEILTEVIKSKQEKMEQLQQDLNAVIGQETKEENYREFCEMVDEARRLREAYYKSAVEVDKVLKQHIVEFANLYKAWKNQASQTLYFASTIAKGFKRSTHVRYVQNNNQDELKAEEFIKAVEADGINLDSVLDTEVTSGQYWQFYRHTDDFPDLAFTEYLMEISKSPIVGKLMDEQKE